MCVRGKDEKRRNFGKTNKFWKYSNVSEGVKLFYENLIGVGIWHLVMFFSQLVHDFIQFH